ncbi:hypothetical protein PAXRUDRAFT_172166 [Paxillus rubicundulus Ve08.2h10]|uniref:Uncharacterized protein n=1 Tax=Paxillus rubicundulus Ve08.2h10 TaxID=930991 RepID=A0A0D0CWZ0_9AGAM|nr:hypothetical protein PAXRUDRAFT_172166 [Paxillus rubicundulus Ve08.2h10]
MISLRADEDTLVQYWALEKDHLKVSTAVLDPNARGHQDSTLAWLWTMDVQRDAELIGCPNIFYRGHWLRAKALKDRWEEEVELCYAGEILRAHRNNTNEFNKDS